MRTSSSISQGPSSRRRPSGRPEIGWKPLHFLNGVSSSIGAVIKPAGFENAQGIISVAALMDPLDPQWKDDPGMKAFDDFLAKDFPEGNRADGLVIAAYNV